MVPRGCGGNRWEPIAAWSGAWFVGGVEGIEERGDASVAWLGWWALLLLWLRGC